MRRSGVRGFPPNFLRRLEMFPRTGREKLRCAALAAALLALVPLLWYAYRVTEREWVGEVQVPFSVRTRRTWTIQRGWDVILREGRPGLRRVRFHGRLRGGIPVSLREISSAPVREGRSEVRVTGASATRNPVNVPRLSRAVRSYRMLATAYDAGSADNSFENAGTTRLGWRTRRGIVAVDPGVIPLRSLLYIEGYGFAWAGDVGGAIKGMRIDLCFNSTEEVLKWGRRQTWVYVIEGVRRNVAPLPGGKGR